MNARLWMYKYCYANKGAIYAKGLCFAAKEAVYSVRTSGYKLNLCLRIITVPTSLLYFPMKEN